MKRLERSELKNLKGGGFAGGDIGGGFGCLQRPVGANDCNCLSGDSGWCRNLQNNNKECYCLSDSSPRCYALNQNCTI